MGDIYTGYFEEEQLSGNIGLVGPQGPPGPQGPKGDTGMAATIMVGEVTTGDPGTCASVTNVGTPGAAVLNFIIPRGAPGEVTEAKLEAAITAHNTSETAHADIRADIAAANLCAEKRLAPLEALARTLDTLNPKGEGTVTATTYGTVTLPKNAANGRLGLVVKGRTVTQIEPNGRALCNDISAFNRNKYDPIITQNTDNIEVEIASSQVHAILGWSATNISPGDYLFLKAEVALSRILCKL